MGNRNIKHTKSAGGVVVNKRGQILVVNQDGLTWSLPNGHIDKNENAEAAARREIYEESGISDLEFIKKLGSYKRYKIGKGGKGEEKSELKMITMFLFKTPQNLLKPVDVKNPEARWVNKEEVVKLLTHPKDKEFFLKIKKRI